VYELSVVEHGGGSLLNCGYT